MRRFWLRYAFLRHFGKRRRRVLMARRRISRGRRRRISRRFRRMSISAAAIRSTTRCGTRRRTKDWALSKRISFFMVRFWCVRGRTESSFIMWGYRTAMFLRRVFIRRISATAGRGSVIITLSGRTELSSGVAHWRPCLPGEFSHRGDQSVGEFRY